MGRYIQKFFSSGSVYFLSITAQRLYRSDDKYCSKCNKISLKFTHVLSNVLLRHPQKGITYLEGPMSHVCRSAHCNTHFVNVLHSGLRV